jgi:hypothetical protein
MSWFYTSINFLEDITEKQEEPNKVWKPSVGSVYLKGGLSAVL